MAECKVCGEKIKEGDEFCSVCAPEHNNLVTENEQGEKMDTKIEQKTVEEQENKIEIKKDAPIVEEDRSKNNASESDSDDDDTMK